MEPFYREVAAGYCCEQASERAKLVFEWVRNTLYSDDDKMDFMLDLSIAAGAKIRAGELPVPARKDGLYDRFL